VYDEEEKKTKKHMHIFTVLLDCPVLQSEYNQSKSTFCSASLPGDTCDPSTPSLSLIGSDAAHEQICNT